MKESLFFSVAINRALEKALELDERVFIIGEDIGVKGGAFGITRGLLEKFGCKRIVDSPISENSLIGLGIGASMTGLRPIVEIMYMDFIALAMDQILNKMSKIHYISQGYFNLPLVIRTTAGGGKYYGPDHSQSLEPLLQNIPGICLAVPSNPNDAYHMLLNSIIGDVPVIFVEYRKLYECRGEVDFGIRESAFGKSKIASEGGDVTIVSYGRMLHACLNVKGRLLRDGICDAEVVDIRYIKPFDKETICQSIAKTGRLVTVEESCLTGGIGAEIVASVTSNNFYEMDAPPLRIGGLDQPIPFSPYLEDKVLPTEDYIYQIIKKSL